MKTSRVIRTKRVIGRAGRGGSSPVIVAVGARRWVLKLRGAGHGVHALVSEIVASSLAESLGLPVPEHSLIDLDEHFESDDKNDELADLLERSIGLNLGYDYLEGATDLREADVQGLSLDFRAAVLWLDELTMNPDRTAKNPNILLWNGQPWLIDQGSALSFQHDLRTLTEQDPRRSARFVSHVFEASRPAMRLGDAALAARLDRPALGRAVGLVPDAFLREIGPESTVRRSRAFYEAFLWKRLQPPRPFR